MYTLTVVLNLHQENHLAERTVASIRKSLNFLNAKSEGWKAVEIIAILDKSNQLTVDIIGLNRDLFDRVYLVDFGDPALARNYGVEVALNNFVAFNDGDDYASENVLYELYTSIYEHYQRIAANENKLQKLEYSRHIVVVPQTMVNFPIISIQRYVNSNSLLVQNMKFTNCFIHRICCYKKILLENPLKENTLSYGFEDWDLNNRLLALGVIFKVSSYIFYYRNKVNNSIFLEQVKNRCVVRNSELYALVNCQNSMSLTHPLNTSKAKLKRKLNRLTLKIYRRFVHLIFALFPSLENILIPANIATETRQHQKFLSQYEDDLIVKSVYIGSTAPLADRISIEVKIYWRLCEFLSKYEFVLIIPWVVLGGADKLIIQHAQALKQSGLKVCILTTLKPGDRIEQTGLDYFDFVEYCPGWLDLLSETKLNILHKAVINCKIQAIHIIQSDLGLQLVNYHSAALREYGIKTMVSLFCPDYDWQKKCYSGYPVMYAQLFANADIIFSDNNFWYDFFKQQNKGNDFNFKKLFSPVSVYDATYRLKTPPTKKILWASRVCNQKLFMVLPEIIKQLPEFHFVIYGNKPEDEANLTILKKLQSHNNFEFRGEYKDISELNLNEFDLYLYTSLFDGIPTIILDMLMSGIPIVSANVGGIMELLGSDYPLFVNEVKAPDAYIAKIKYYFLIQDMVTAKMLVIRQKIIDEYTDKKFSNDYLLVLKGLLDGSR